MVQPYYWSLEEFQGLKPQDRAKLYDLGIITNQDLLVQTLSPQAQITLAQQLQLHLHHVQKWRAIAELGCIPGVGYQYSGLLLHSGIGSIAQLAAAKPGPIHRSLLRLQVANLHRRDLCPSCSEINQWIKQAQGLQRYFPRG